MCAYNTVHNLFGATIDTAKLNQLSVSYISYISAQLNA